MPPIEMRVEAFTGEEIARGVIPETPGDYYVEGLTVQIHRTRKNGRGPNGNKIHIKAAQISIPEISSGRTWLKLNSGKSEFRLPRSKVRIKAKLVKEN